MSKALGLVETRGLVAAIEAADAMLKAANVTLAGKEKTDPALITIKVVGETAAVRAAVDAGAAAAGRVGVLVSTHIIPQPDLQMILLLPEIEESKSQKEEIKSNKEETKSIKEEAKILPKEEKKVLTVAEEKPVAAKEPKPKIKTERFKEMKEGLVSSTSTIARLRQEALGFEDEPKKGHVTSPVQKKEFKMEEVELLNVHQLRRFARSTEGFPIQGREISRANRKELLDYFKKLI